MIRKGMTRRERQVTDIEEIKDILDKCMVVHLGLIDGDEPYVVPLNYGYTILRSGIARSIMGAGLHPAIGIFHKNKYNSMRLADDLMEPFRPIVDYFVYKIIEKEQYDLTADVKNQLVNILYLDLDGPRGRSPVINRMQSLSYSYAYSLEILKKNLDLPILKESDLHNKINQ